MAQKIFKVAHRGASGYEPENTMASFRKAIELKADMIELDVHICKTGEVVVRHEHTVDGTKNGRSFIADQTLTELKSLDMGRGERVPTLEEVLDLLDKKIKVNIELKGRGTAMPVRAIIEKYVEKGWNLGDFLVSSFQHDELEQIRKFQPEIKIGVLSAELFPGVPKFADKIKAHSVNAPVDKVDKEFVKKVHEMGMKMFVYAANKDHEIELAKALDADYICSNFPDKI